VVSSLHSIAYRLYGNGIAKIGIKRLLTDIKFDQNTVRKARKKLNRLVLADVVFNLPEKANENVMWTKAMPSQNVRKSKLLRSISVMSLHGKSKRNLLHSNKNVLENKDESSEEELSSSEDQEIDEDDWDTDPDWVVN
jgi:copper homeostasis protein CutC